MRAIYVTSAMPILHKCKVNPIAIVLWKTPTVRPLLEPRCKHFIKHCSSGKKELYVMDRKNPCS